MSRPQKYNNERLKSYMNKNNNNKKKYAATNGANADTNNNNEIIKDKNNLSYSSNSTFVQTTPVTTLHGNVSRITVDNPLANNSNLEVKIVSIPVPPLNLQQQQQLENTDTDSSIYKYSLVENNNVGQDQVTHL